MKDLSDSQKAKEIIRIIRMEAERLASRYISAFGDLKREETESDMWDRQQKQGGYMEFSPYNVDRKRKIMEDVSEQKRYREEILAYAINVFLDKMETK